MANWCSSGITFYSENRSLLYKFFERIKEIYESESTQENTFGHGWMGDYANTFYPSIGADKINCRGYITYIDDTVRHVDKFFAFTICTETAGDSKMGLWAYILKDFFPDVKMAYVAEECGCEYYCKFDETGLFYPHDYYVDIAYPGEDDEVEYIEDHQFYSLQDVHDWLDANLPFKYEKKGDEYELEKEINSKLDLYDSDEFFCTIAKYENISPSEFELKK